MKEPKTPTAIRIRPDLLAALDDEVKRQGLPSRNYTIEQLIARFLHDDCGRAIPVRVTL